jgi:hypothetical protein
MSPTPPSPAGKGAGVGDGDGPEPQFLQSKHVLQQWPCIQLSPHLPQLFCCAQVAFESGGLSLHDGPGLGGDGPGDGPAPQPVPWQLKHDWQQWPFIQLALHLPHAFCCAQVAFESGGLSLHDSVLLPAKGLFAE